jgi:hypothetical protein
MTRQRLRRILPIVVALMFFALSFSRTHERGVWLGLGVVFLIIGIRRKRAVDSASGDPDA